MRRLIILFLLAVASGKNGKGNSQKKHSKRDGTIKLTYNSKTFELGEEPGRLNVELGEVNFISENTGGL